MPLLSKTLIKINRLIPSDAKQLTIENIRNAFGTLVTDYNAQTLSRKRHIQKLKDAQTKINYSSNLTEALLILATLHSALTMENSSFALKALQPILTALQLNPIQREWLSKKQTAAAILIQTRFRTFSTQKKYKIKHLTPSEQESYPAFVVGNDPVIHNLHKYKQEPDDKDPIAVVGTSVLRSIEIGLELSNGTQLPKIIIIDNSEQVATLWHNLRAFSMTHRLESDFFKLLPSFLDKNKNLYRDLKDGVLDLAPSQNIMAYLTGLSKKYGFVNLCSAISATTAIKQNWENRSTFQRLKASLDRVGISKIYVYPSNIISCVDSVEKRAILENIGLLNPQLIIHTDDEINRPPEKVFLLEDSKPETALATLPKNNFFSLESMLGFPLIIGPSGQYSPLSLLGLMDPTALSGLPPSLTSSQPSTTSSGLGSLPPGVTLIRFSQSPTPQLLSHPVFVLSHC